MILIKRFSFRQIKFNPRFLDDPEVVLLNYLHNLIECPWILQDVWLDHRKSYHFYCIIVVKLQDVYLFTKYLY